MLRFRIYQIHPQSVNLFKNFSSIGTPDPNDYVKVYDGFMPDEDKGDPNEKTDFERLEKLFCIFNMHHPQDYHARSMSVSDIVEVYDENSNRYYFCDTFGFEPLPAFNPMNVNPLPECYTLVTLTQINPTFDATHRVTQRDVDIANECVEAIRESRSDIRIQTGDIVELTTKHGNYYRYAHIETYDAETDRWSVCEKPMTPYVTVKGHTGIQCDTSGGPWSGIPNNLKLIGKRAKTFWVFGHCGMCGGGGINFQAEVNVWEYKQDDPIYGEYSTKSWAKHYISCRVDEIGNPKSGQYRYTSSGFALEAKEDYDAWLKTYRGVEFKGNWPNQTVIFCYREKRHYAIKAAWDQIDLPMDTRLNNGVKLCKVGYNDETHVVDVYGIKKLNAQHATNLTAKDLHGAIGGLVGVKEDIEEFYKRMNDKASKVHELFTPQEVYDYEYGNHECEYQGDDTEAIQIIMELFGPELAKTVSRKYACSVIGVLAPNFNELLNRKWDKVKEKEAESGVIFMSDVNNWLSGFLTQEIMADLRSKGKVCIEANWGFWVERIHEPMIRFKNYGTMFTIYKEKNKHIYCDASFIKYWVGFTKQEKTEAPLYIKLIAYGRNN